MSMLKKREIQQNIEFQTEDFIFAPVTVWQLVLSILVRFYILIVFGTYMGPYIWDHTWDHTFGTYVKLFFFLSKIVFIWRFD